METSLLKQPGNNQAWPGLRCSQTQSVMPAQAAKALSLLAPTCVRSHFSGVRLSATPWTMARQASLSMGFSKQEYWSGLPFPSLITLNGHEFEQTLGDSGGQGSLVHCSP